MKRVAVLLVIALAAVACGDDDAATTTVPSEGTTAATAADTSATSDTTVVVEDTTADTPPPEDGHTDCREIWSEEFVATVIGNADAVTGNSDNSACVYSLSPGLALAWRTDTMAGFETSRSGAALTGATTDVEVCDGGWWVELQGAGIIMEAYDAAQGRVYNATITGAPVDVETWVGWGSELLGSAC